MSDKEEILQAIGKLSDRMGHIEEKVDRLDLRITHLESKVDKLDKDVDRLTIYQQANQNLVNLAFGLIASATIVTVAGSIFTR